MKPGKKFYRRPGIIAVITVLLLGALAVPATLAVTGRPGQETDVEVEEKPPKAEAASGVDEPAPRIRFEKTMYDFGKVGPRSRNSCEFKFTNAGGGVLKISEVKTTCGCTVPKLSKREYAPGESGTIAITYYADTQAGPTSERSYVVSNDKANSRVTLTIKAEIVPKVNYEPRRIELSVKEENAGCPDITLSSIDGRPFAIKLFRSTANAITVDYDPSVEATKFVLKPKVNVEKLLKGFKGQIGIHLTHPECKEVVIPFDALAEFEAKPASINVLKAKPKEPVIREVLVLNNYGDDFEIESVSSKKGVIKVLSQEKIGEQYKFELEITPPVIKDKTKMVMDVLFVNIKGGKRLEVPCRVFYAVRARKPRRAGIAYIAAERKPEKAKAEIDVEMRFILVPADANEIKDFLEEEKIDFFGSQADPNYTGILGVEQVEQLLKLVQANPGSKMLAAPKVRVLDGEEATMRIQKTIRYKYADPNSPSEQLVQKELPIGTIIQVKPSIQSDNKDILLELDFEHSNLLGFEDGLPQTEITSIQTRVVVPDGGTLLLGGQKITVEVEKKSGVPILSDVPLVGGIFEKRSKVKVHKMLLVLVKAAIIPKEGTGGEEY